MNYVHVKVGQHMSYIVSAQLSVPTVCNSSKGLWTDDSFPIQIHKRALLAGYKWASVRCFLGPFAYLEICVQKAFRPGASSADTLIAVSGCTEHKLWNYVCKQCAIILLIHSIELCAFYCFCVILLWNRVAILVDLDAHYSRKIHRLKTEDYNRLPLILTA